MIEKQRRPLPLGVHRVLDRRAMAVVARVIHPCSARGDCSIVIDATWGDTAPSQGVSRVCSRYWESPPTLRPANQEPPGCKS
jgi:hypothetical protein